MKNYIISLILICISIVPSFSQNVQVVGTVEDVFLKKPLRNVHISVLNMDSSVVISSVETYKSIGMGSSGFVEFEKFNFSVPAERKSYWLHAQTKGYNDLWRKFEVNAKPNSEIVLPVLRMRKSMDRQLSEATVTATRIKMYYKGDTLVYNADAFKLPDGSMLDALIAQLPGVTINENSEIFVNGKKVEELLLGAQSFMGGKKEVLLENLPYYTVRHIKVYDQQSDKSKALGFDVDRRKYVMDVELKDEYSIGMIGNAEVASGTKKRWLGRAFALGFSDNFRVTLYGNVNNMGESQYIGQIGHFSSGLQPRSLTKIYKGMAEISYLPKSKPVKNSLQTEYVSSSNINESRQKRDLFLEETKPTSIEKARHDNENRRVSVQNDLTLTAPFYLKWRNVFNHTKNSSSNVTDFNEWNNDGLTTTMLTRGMGHSKEWKLFSQLDGAVKVGNNKHIDIRVVGEHTQAKTEQAKLYETARHQIQIYEKQANSNDIYKRNTWAVVTADFTTDILSGLRLGTSVRGSYTDDVSHDFLYHPDSLLLPSYFDALKASFDPDNSYDSRSQVSQGLLNINLTRRKLWKEEKEATSHKRYDSWKLDISVPYVYERLDYKRGSIDVVKHQSMAFFHPSFAYYSPSYNEKQVFRFNIDYRTSAPSLRDKISYRDDSNPLYVQLGNENLKGNAQSNLQVYYKYRIGIDVLNFIDFKAASNYQFRNVAQSVTYNPATGVYTYKPVNVHGNYKLNGTLGFAHRLDKKKLWYIETHHGATYYKSIDHTMLAGANESRENRVGTFMLQDDATITYNAGKLHVNASGAFQWRRSNGKMDDFTVLDVFDFNYGIMGRYTIPHLKTTLRVDAMMKSRRGYSSEKLNTDDFLLNASLSQPFLKGKLVARIDAYDILHQQSSTQYDINAQGRTETWRRSLPNYVMLHLQWMFNKNPKKK